MRYRKLDSDGDYSFGHGSTDFFVDSAEAVAQSVKTRLLLIVGEWFMDTSDGTDWSQILGKSNQITRDRILKNRILGTTGVTEITSFSSALENRKLTVTCEIVTEYGTTTVDVTI